MLTLLQATQPVPSQWASDLVFVVTSVLGAVGAFLGVWALLKGTRAETKADGNAEAVKQIKDDVNTRMTNVQTTANAAQSTAAQAMLHAAPPSKGPNP